MNIVKFGSPLNPRNLWKTVPIALLLCVTLSQSTLAQEKQRMLRTLTVSGRGTQEIPTTLSQITLGVEVQGKTAQEVQKEADRRSSDVVELLKNRKVEKLQTTGISLNPVYSYNNNVQRLTGYTATNTVSFRLPTERAGTLLDEAVKAGATQISSISFTASEDALALAKQQALKEATQEAQQQAGAVLSALGFQAKEVVSIEINGANAPAPPPRPYSTELARQSVAKDASTPIVGGEQQVEATVTLQISY